MLRVIQMNCDKPIAQQIDETTQSLGTKFWTLIKGEFVSTLTDVSVSVSTLSELIQPTSIKNRLKSTLRPGSRVWGDERLL